MNINAHVLYGDVCLFMEVSSVPAFEHSEGGRAITLNFATQESLPNIGVHAVPFHVGKTDFISFSLIHVISKDMLVRESLFIAAGR